MPLALTTPKSAGDLDPNASQYAQVKIIEFHQFERRGGSVEFTCELGNTVESNWVPGVAPKSTFTVSGESYQTVRDSHTTNDGELTFAAAKRALYEWLVSEGHYAGTVV